MYELRLRWGNDNDDARLQSVRRSGVQVRGNARGWCGSARQMQSDDQSSNDFPYLRNVKHHAPFLAYYIVSRTRKSCSSKADQRSHSVDDVISISSGKLIVEKSSHIARM